MSYPKFFIDYQDGSISLEELQDITARVESLLPCPFCGGKADLMDMGYPHWVYCTKCGARVHGGIVGEYRGAIASIAAWNRRVK